jgi:hypothetical protein
VLHARNANKRMDNTETIPHPARKKKPKQTKTETCRLSERNKGLSEIRVQSPGSLSKPASSKPAAPLNAAKCASLPSRKSELSASAFASRAYHTHQCELVKDEKVDDLVEGAPHAEQNRKKENNHWNQRFVHQARVRPRIIKKQKQKSNPNTQSSK